MLYFGSPLMNHNSIIVDHTLESNLNPNLKLIFVFLLRRVEHTKYLRAYLQLSFLHINYFVKIMNLGMWLLYRSRNCYSFTVSENGISYWTLLFVINRKQFTLCVPDPQIFCFLCVGKIRNT